MPEGPSIIILKEAIQSFKGKKVIKAEGYAKIEFAQFRNKKIKDIKTWGKHLLICFDDFFVRVHLLMFGSYRINERKETNPKLSLQFSKGELNFYAGDVKLSQEDPNEVYDWSADIMNDNWNSKKAIKKLAENPTQLICDSLLDQQIFSGVGNIIKSEALFRAMLHPKNKVGKIPPKAMKLLLSETRKYSFDFLKWKKEGTLKKHWLAYSKKVCPRCEIPLHKEILGKTKRRTFFCNNCQVLYK